jgi:hypothetical protein
MKDVLFLLSSGFTDGEGAPYYCPNCVIFEGLLHLYPELASQLIVRRVDFQRPRPEIVSLLGEENQSCPVLLINRPSQDLGGLSLKQAGTRLFIDDPQEIGNYLASAYGIPRPH